MAETQEETFERIAAVEFSWDHDGLPQTGQRLNHGYRCAHCVSVRRKGLLFSLSIITLLVGLVGHSRELLEQLLVGAPTARLSANEIAAFPGIRDDVQP